MYASLAGKPTKNLIDLLPETNPLFDNGVGSGLRDARSVHVGIRWILTEIPT